MLSRLKRAKIARVFCRGSVPKELVDTVSLPENPEPLNERANMRAYIGGPLFNQGERWWNAEIDSRVRKAGFTTYVPQRDGIKLEHKSDVLKIFEEDKKAVSQADLIVTNLDGIDVDAGTAWEMGFAHGLGKHCVGVYTDWRLHFKWQTVNLMIQCSVDKLVFSLEELDEYLQHFVANARKSGSKP
jgi:nucleoside 2-deoxyribosyltransferase